MMRVLSQHLTPLDRQLQESLNIVRASANPQENLNQKSEWGGSKIPGILVRTPKGTSKVRPARTPEVEEIQGLVAGTDSLERGNKRIRIKEKSQYTSTEGNLEKVSRKHPPGNLPEMTWKWDRATRIFEQQ